MFETARRRHRSLGLNSLKRSPVKALSFSLFHSPHMICPLLLHEGKSLRQTPVAAVVVEITYWRRLMVVRCWLDVDATAAVATTASTVAGVGHCVYSTAAAASAADVRSYRASDEPWTVVSAVSSENRCSSSCRPTSRRPAISCHRGCLLGPTVSSRSPLLRRPPGALLLAQPAS